MGLAAPPTPSGAEKLADKVAFLSRRASHGLGPGLVERVETHMSWLFFANGMVLKLKKPVRFAYLDFSTLAKRERACRTEVALNRALAPDVYLRVEPLRAGPRGLAVGGGAGAVVDWLVLMRPLDRAEALDRRLADRDPPTAAEIDRISDTLARFYRRAPRVRIDPVCHLAAWRRALAADRPLLLCPALGLPRGLVRRVDGVLRRTLRTRPELLAAQVRSRRILDAHGDLRPEHIFLERGDVQVIDRLEFNAALRIADPIDELAFLDLECERLGAPDIGRTIRRRVQRRLGERPPEALVLFYRCHRALLRARLSIAHLLEPSPRTPEKWPRQARAYLAIAARDARRLDVLLNWQGDRRAPRRRAYA